MSEATEDLVDLIHHPGWLRLKEWARKEFVDQVAVLAERAADHANDDVAMSHLRQSIAGKRAIEVLLRWPEEQIAKQQPRQAPNASRGGM